MANEQYRLYVEQLKNVIQSLGYALSSYNIGPDKITATVKINSKDLDQNQQNLVGIQFRRIIATQAWTITAQQMFNDSLVFSIEKEV